MIYWCHMVVCILELHFTLEWTWLGRKGQVYITVPMSATFTKLTPTVHLDMIYWCHVVVCVLDLHFTLQWPRHRMTIAGTLWWFPLQCTIMSSLILKKIPVACVLWPWTSWHVKLEVNTRHPWVMDNKFVKFDACIQMDIGFPIYHSHTKSHKWINYSKVIPVYWEGEIVTLQWFHQSIHMCIYRISCKHDRASLWACLVVPWYSM